MVELVVLRHRAYCRSCRSKLPPRTEVWWEAASDEVTCVTCHRLESAGPLDPAEEPAGGSRPAPTWWDPAPPAAPPVERDEVSGAGPAEPVLAPEVVDRLRAGGERPGPGMPGYAPPAVPVPERPRRPEPPPVPPPPVAEAPPAASAATPAGAADGGPAPATERIAGTLDAAADQGLITLHRRRVPGVDGVLDHLVVAPNGLWVVQDLPAPEGKVERRDVGDWFSSDPRLYVADQDRSDLVARVVELVEGVGAALAETPVSALSRRGVLCFADAPVGWFANPFIIQDVSITWRMKLVEPMVSSVLYGPPIRAELASYLDTVFLAS